jgi:hypothetical protein
VSSNKLIAPATDEQVEQMRLLATIPGVVKYGNVWDGRLPHSIPDTLSAVLSRLHAAEERGAALLKALCGYTCDHRRTVQAACEFAEGECGCSLCLNARAVIDNPPAALHAATAPSQAEREIGGGCDE